MKIKVIDLLNMISKGEEVPKKIKWENIIYAYSEYDKDYLEYPFSNEEYKGLFDMRDNILTQFLNDEVEIIEEDKKIEKISWSEKESLAGNLMASKKQEILARRTEKLKSSLNELIDEINNLKEK